MGWGEDRSSIRLNVLHNNTTIWSHQTENSAPPPSLRGYAMKCAMIFRGPSCASRLQKIAALRRASMCAQLRIVHSLNEVCILLRQLGAVLNQNADAINGIVLRRCQGKDAKLTLRSSPQQAEQRCSALSTMLCIKVASGRRSLVWRPASSIQAPAKRHSALI